MDQFSITVFIANTSRYWFSVIYYYVFTIRVHIQYDHVLPSFEHSIYVKNFNAYGAAIGKATTPNDVDRRRFGEDLTIFKCILKPLSSFKETTKHHYQTI